MYSQSVNHKRIAKNSLILYLRMLVVTLMGLYTSRLVLMALGTSDYGVYAVAGGVVVMASFLVWTLRETILRYLNFSIARNEDVGRRQVFSSSFLIVWGAAGCVFLLAESLGLWFLNSGMNIPEDRITAANWVFQLSIIAFLFDLISTPYEAVLIAHEKISSFAWIGVANACVRVLTAMLLFNIDHDRLVAYSLFGLVVSVLLRLVYVMYCRNKFPEYVFRRGNVSRWVVVDMSKLAFWSQFGHLGFSLHQKGMPLVVNIFFGVTVNAALSIALALFAQARSLMENFMTALGPQLTKCYATGGRDELYQLICCSSRVAFSLVLLVDVPLLLITPELLEIWLKDVPIYTVVFVRILLMTLLVDSFSMVLEITNTATGKVRDYGLWIMTVAICHLVLTAVFLLLGFDAQYALYLYLVAILVEQTIRIVIVCGDTGLEKVRFLKDIVRYMIPTCVVAFSFPTLIRLITGNGWFTLLCVIIFGVLWTGMCAWILCFSRSERAIVLTECKELIHRFL